MSAIIATMADQVLRANLRNKILDLRVRDLQQILQEEGMSKRGRKEELRSRALALIDQGNANLTSRINSIHEALLRSKPDKKMLRVSRRRHLMSTGLTV